MSFNWDDFFSLASDLEKHCVQNGHDESRYRSSISRSYYAAYHAAIEAAKAKNIQLKRRDASGRILGSHEQVHYTFEHDTTSPSCPAIGMKLRRMKNIRVKADYKNPYPGVGTSSSALQSDATANLTTYIEIVDLLKKI